MFRQYSRGADRLKQPRGKFHVGIGGSHHRAACDASPIVATWLVCCLIRYTRQGPRVITGETSSLAAKRLPRRERTARLRSIRLGCTSAVSSNVLSIVGAIRLWNSVSYDLRQSFSFRQGITCVQRALDLTSTASQTSACLSLSDDEMRMAGARPWILQVLNRD